MTSAKQKFTVTYLLTTYLLIGVLLILHVILLLLLLLLLLYCGPCQSTSLAAVTATFLDTNVDRFTQMQNGIVGAFDDLE